jgi:hypothetical protein
VVAVAAAVAVDTAVVAAAAAVAAVVVVVAAVVAADVSAGSPDVGPREARAVRTFERKESPPPKAGFLFI